MRIRRVTAIAFGPFKDQSLEFTDGLTVLYGKNEAGKSSWHAAIYAAVCGIKSGKGKPKKADQEFRDRHRPWDGGGWKVEALLSLEAPGDRDRGIEIVRDLDLKASTVD